LANFLFLAMGFHPDGMFKKSLFAYLERILQIISVLIRKFDECIFYSGNIIWFLAISSG